MSAEDKFFFDLNGFIIVRGVLTGDEVAAANAAIDAHRQDVLERADPQLRNSRAGTLFSGEGPGRCDLGGMLGWPKPYCDPFRALLAHDRLIPYLTELCGAGYRMDHLPMVIVQGKGSEGFHLHGGPIDETGRFDPTLQYRCVNGHFFNSLLAMSVQLVDHNPGDGGFCVVRGSHKLNFPVPDAFMHGAIAQENLYQPITKAGDVVFFSEATVHGALPWNADHERRIALYRFSPANMAYSRSYHPEWAPSMMEGLTPNQRAVLEAPYAVRCDRAVVKLGQDEPSVVARAPKKKEFSRQVFGTDYF